MLLIDDLFYFLNHRLRLSIQSFIATHALNLSAGVSYCSVLRGRSFN